MTVTSIAASHSDDNVQPDPNASKHIFVIDFDGFHMVHLGSTGQTKLTDEQVAAIGQPDIAFSVLQDVSGTNHTSPLKLIEQMNPKLLIPTTRTVTTTSRASSTRSPARSSPGSRARSSWTT
ncbi:MAG TPA: MBL fold metallo-hydrolase [Candidatus Limnocylindrales bacterium]